MRHLRVLAALLALSAWPASAQGPAPTLPPGYMPVEANIIEPLGSFDIVDLKVGSKMLRARTKAGYVSGPGEKVHARVDPEQAHFFDTASGKSLGVRL